MKKNILLFFVIPWEVKKVIILYNLNSLKFVYVALLRAGSDTPSKK